MEDKSVYGIFFDNKLKFFCKNESDTLDFMTYICMTDVKMPHNNCYSFEKLPYETYLAVIKKQPHLKEFLKLKEWDDNEKTKNISFLKRLKNILIRLKGCFYPG